MAKEKKEIKLNRDFDNCFDEMLLDQSSVQNKKDGITNIPISQLPLRKLRLWLTS